jgi:hypothetical protein
MPVTIFAIFAGLWTFLVVYAQWHCSIIPSIGKQCHGEEGDVWMVPLFTSPIGGFAVLGLIAMAIAKFLRR